MKSKAKTGEEGVEDEGMDGNDEGEKWVEVRVWNPTVANIFPHCHRRF